jgi:ankyrin repeat protein
MNVLPLIAIVKNDLYAFQQLSGSRYYGYGNLEDAAENWDKIPLTHLAAASGSLTLLTYLVEDKNMSLDDRDHCDRRPLHAAAAAGELKTAHYCLTHWDKVNDSDGVNVQDEDGMTPFLFAAKYGHPPMLQYLFENDANIQQKDNCHRSALHFAAKYGHVGAVELLTSLNIALNARAEADYEDFDDLDYCAGFDNEQYTALDLAVSNGYLSVVKHLMAQTDINADLTRLLFFAIKMNRLSVIRYLIEEKGANPRDEIYYDHKAALCEYAREYADKPVVSYLDNFIKKAQN